MTVNNTQSQPTDVATATRQMLDSVAQDVFLNKMAAAGFPAQSSEQAAQMINDALLVEQLTQHPQVKQAFAQNDLSTRASANLQKLAMNMGFGPQPVDADAEAIKLAQAYLQSSPDVYAAGLLAGLERANGGV